MLGREELPGCRPGHSVGEARSTRAGPLTADPSYQIRSIPTTSGDRIYCKVRPASPAPHLHQPACLAARPAHGRAAAVHTHASRRAQRACAATCMRASLPTAPTALPWV